jgi:hypothetical protein
MLIIIFILFFIFHPQFALAIDPTPPESTPTSNSGLDEIKKIREAVQQKVQEKLRQISAPEANKKKGIIGKITKIDGLAITLEDSLLANRNLIITTETIIIDKNRNKTKLESLKSGNEILAMGYTTEDGSLDTKRIVIIDSQSIGNPLSVTIGKIVDISRASPIFVLIPSSDKDIQYQITTDSKTEITSTDKTKLSFSDLKNGQRTILIFKPDTKTSKSFYAIKIVNLDYQFPTPTVKPKTP